MPNTHLELLKQIKLLEKELEKNEEDKRKLIIEIREAYGKFGPNFAAQVRKLIGELTVESMSKDERMNSLISEISQKKIGEN